MLRASGSMGALLIAESFVVRGSGVRVEGCKVYRGLHNLNGALGDVILYN